MNPRLSIPDIEAPIIARMKAEGESDAAIAVLYRCKPLTVWNFRKKHGIKADKPVSKPKVKAKPPIVFKQAEGARPKRIYYDHLLKHIVRVFEQNRAMGDLEPERQTDEWTN